MATAAWIKDWGLALNATSQKRERNQRTNRTPPNPKHFKQIKGRKMHAQVTPIHALLGVGVPYIIPIYQRRYAWASELIENLIEDLQEHHGEHPYILGAVTWQTEGFARYIIDGQQRLTSISLIIKAIKTQLGDRMPLDLIQPCNNCLYSDHEHLTPKIKLKIEDSNAYYDVIIGQGIQHGNINHTININYTTTQEKIKNFTDVEAENLLRKIFFTNVVEISVNRAERPQEIFESLNSKGQNLTKIDLITNLIFMGMQPAVQNLHYINNWATIENHLNTDILATDFLRAFLAIKLKRVENLTRDNLYDVFKEEYFKNINHNPDERGPAAINDLNIFFNAYRAVTNPEHHVELPNALGTLLKNLNSLGVSQANALVTFLETKRNQEITTGTAISILKMIESYIARRLIIGLPMAGMFRRLTALAIQLNELSTENQPDANLNNSYLEATINHLANFSGNGRLPRDDEVRLELRTRNFYQAANANLFFKKIIEYIYPGFDIGIENATIEHIMPQRLTPHWVDFLGQNAAQIHQEKKHSIGNLTIIPLQLNAFMGQVPLETKIQYLQGGVMARNGALPPPPYQNIFNKIYETQGVSWGVDEIDRNANHYADILLQIYPQPQGLDDALNKEFIPIPSITHDEVVAVFGGNNVRATLYDTIYQGLEDANLISVRGNAYIRLMTTEDVTLISIHPTHGANNIRVMLNITEDDAAPGTPMGQLIEEIICTRNDEAYWVNHPGPGAAGNFRMTVNNQSLEECMRFIKKFIKIQIQQNK